MRSGGNSGGYVSVHVGADWWTHLSRYEDHTPILSLDAGSTSVSISIAGNQPDASAVEFARELAGRMAEFAAEVERLHNRHNDEASDGATAGEAA